MDLILAERHQCCSSLELIAVVLREVSTIVKFKLILQVDWALIVQMEHENCIPNAQIEFGPLSNERFKNSSHALLLCTFPPIDDHKYQQRDDKHLAAK